MTEITENNVLLVKENKGSVLILKVRPFNKGNQFAKFINYYLEVPAYIIDSDKVLRFKKINNDKLEFSGDNTIRDLLDAEYTLFGTKEIRGPSRYDPVLPGLKGPSRDISLRKDISLGEQEINWKVYADNAPINSGNIKLNEIKYTSKKL